MTLFDIIFLAYALSIDAGIVSFGMGLIFSRNKRKNSLILASFTGFFQFFMPFIGWFLAKLIYGFFEPFSKIIAFLIFFILGLKFICDAFNKKEAQNGAECLSLSCLFMLSAATSIDALGAGVNIYFLNAPVVFASVAIGLVTFLNSMFSFWFGYLFKRFPSKYLEIFAGFILIFLAFKTL